MVVILLVMLVTACNHSSAKLISLENRQALATEVGLLQEVAFIFVKW